MKLFRFVLFALLFVPVASGQDAPKEKTYATGYKAVAPEVKKAQVRKTGWLQFAKATAPTWDCRQLGLVPPVVNQADCGSCWDFAGSGTCTSALIKAGYGKADGSLRMSEQYVLDCGRNGGCNGDDHSSVFNMFCGDGLVAAAEYGPYQAREGRCKDTAGMKRYKGGAWGYCDAHADGPASVQSIKDAMANYGPISVAIAANNAFMNVRPGEVFVGNSRDINHEVILVGWDDAKGKSVGAETAWILRNSWGTDWGDGGYCWIGAGSNGVGTDAAWVTVAPLPPPPPGPTPPVPPGPVPPGPTPPFGSVTVTLTPEQVKAVVDQITAPGTGAAFIHADMTLTELIAAIEKAGSGKKAPCQGDKKQADEIADLKRGLDAVMKLLLKQQEKKPDK